MTRLLTPIAVAGANLFAFAAPFALGHRLLLARGVVRPGWRGLGYGLGVFLVGALPVYLVVLMAVRLPAEVLAAWAAQSGGQYALAGGVCGWAISPRPGQ